MTKKILFVLLDVAIGSWCLYNYHKEVDKDLSDLILGVLLLAFAVSRITNKFTEED